MDTHSGRTLLFWSLKGGETDSLSRQRPDPVDLCWRRQTGGARTANQGPARTFLPLWRCLFLHGALSTEDIKQSRPASEVTASSQRCTVDYKERSGRWTSFCWHPSGTRATSIVEKWDYFVVNKNKGYRSESGKKRSYFWKSSLFCLLIWKKTLNRFKWLLCFFLLLWVSVLVVLVT